MAQIILKNEMKKMFADELRANLNKVGLSASTEGASETNFNYGTTPGSIGATFTGNKEILDLEVDGTTTFKIKNSLINTPLLIFTVANSQTPKEYHLLSTAGAGNYRDVVITTSKAQATFDTAIQLRQIEIEFKGDGE